MTHSPSSFVEALADVRLSKVFNPYSDLCDLHDEPDSATRRRHNLELSLAAAVEL